MKINHVLLFMLLFGSFLMFSSCEKETVLPVEPMVDCEDLSGNIGDICATADVSEGIISAACNCVEKDKSLDCANLGGNIGGSCEIAGMPQGGTITADCGCESKAIDSEMDHF